MRHQLEPHLLSWNATYRTHWSENLIIFQGYLIILISNLCILKDFHCYLHINKHFIIFRIILWKDCFFHIFNIYWKFKLKEWSLRVDHAQLLEPTFCVLFLYVNNLILQWFGAELFGPMGQIWFIAYKESFIGKKI